MLFVYLSLVIAYAGLLWTPVYNNNNSDDDLYSAVSTGYPTALYTI